MKFPAFLLAAFLLTTTAYAQKTGLINSGEVIDQAAKLYDSSYYKKALGILSKVSRSDTNYIRALYEKALSCEADSQYTQGIRYCQEALALKEQREYVPEIYNTYGNILNDINQFDHSEKIFDYAIKKYPQYGLLYFNKGIMMLKRNKLHDAELLFQKALLVNPYVYSAHYQLALTALKEGKLIPAFLSSVGYLLMVPQGKYFSQSIKILSQISMATDTILAYKNKRQQELDPNYQMMEDIVLSKIALDKQYKPAIQMDDAIFRQIQVIFEKLEYNAQSSDFWIQYYLPYYQQIFKNGKFENFIYHTFSNVNIDAIQVYNKKNKKELDIFLNQAADYFNNIRATQQLKLSDRDTVAKKYAYNNGVFIGKGQLINDGKDLVGHWDFCYPGGNIKSTGIYNQNGKREGLWVFYDEVGNVKSKENYADGKLQGDQYYYYSNGNLSEHDVQANDQLEGLISTYYYGGAKKMEVAFKQGKRNGEEKSYYDNGNIKQILHYINGVMDGPSKSYYKSGGIKEIGQYVAGKADGPIKTYTEDGRLSAESQYVKDKMEGEWRSYYRGGGIKEKRHYIGDQETGLHEEFYESGQLSETLNAKAAKQDGETIYYTKDGKVYGRYMYSNGVLKGVKHFDAVTGKQIYAAEMKGGQIDATVYTPDGIKKSHYFSDQKGNLTGPDTLFFPSGKINEIRHYANGELNGLLTTYYLNGIKKSEINTTDGKDDGYYQRYFSNGKLQTEGWLRNGESQGEWINYDISGNLITKTNYLNDELNGYKEEYNIRGKKVVEQKYYKGVLQLMTQYDANEKVIAVDSFYNGSGKFKRVFPNGKTMAQGDLVTGCLNGPYKTYFFDGSIESEYSYKNGLLDSTYTYLYYGGAKRSVGKYHQGNKTGKWLAYNDDGVLASVSEYVNDELNGERVYYNTDGTKDFVAQFKDNDYNGLSSKFEADGSLVYQSMFEDDNIVSYTYTGSDGKLVPFIPINKVNGAFKSYFANGKPSRECIYSDGVRNGKSTVYYSNGQIHTEDTVLYGLNEGLSKEYYADGKVKTERNYLADNLNGVSKEYYKNGVLRKESNYLNDQNDGPEKYYDINGKLIKTLLYENGRLTAVKNEK